MLTIKDFFLISLFTTAVLPAHSDSLTAEFQTRLKLAGENPGPIDGSFGNKTNVAANNFFDTNRISYSSKINEANNAIKTTFLNNAKQHQDQIFKTTSDYLESHNTTVFLESNNKIWDVVRDKFDQNSGGGVSKWYQPDITGDGTPDLVFFGMGPGYQSECDIEKCGDNWLKKPVIFELKNNSDSNSTDIKLLDQNEIFGGDIYNRGTGGKSIFTDFNNDGFDDFYLPSEGPVKGSKIHKGGRDVLLISNGDGTYRDDAPKYKLLNVGSFQHWTASGDIDNDGDVDFIFHNLKAKTGLSDRITCFINDGHANFSVKDCVDAPSARVRNRYNSWGGALFDLNGDNILDLWLSRNQYNSPVVILGDGSGQFKKENTVEVYLPNNWPNVMKQFGYVVAADLEDDGYNEIFFSVQGISSSGCKGRIGGYCGSYVGYFKNENGFLKFAGFIKKFEKDFFIQEPFYESKWSASSMIVLKDIIGNDGRKDLFLKRHYSNPFFKQTKIGDFKQTEPPKVSLNRIPNNCALQLSTCSDVDLCLIAVNNFDDWDARDWKNDEFKREAKSRGISCGIPKWK